MIAADTSSISAYFTGESGADVQLLDAVLQNGLLRLPPVVLTELLSDPGSQSALASFLAQFKFLEITEGYWERAGKSRRRLANIGLKVKVADALIAQSCIDYDVSLITRDTDFRRFAKHCSLRLA
jgi:predicted nucleic acid-binding protein